MSSPRALIFDMDGVLIDSEPLWHEAEIEAFAEAGLILTPDDCLHTTGLRVDETVAYWCGRHPGLSPRRDLLVTSILDRLVELVARRGVLKPGVEEVLDRVRSRGLRLALASSSPYRVIHAVLGAFGLDTAFEVVHSAEEEERGKPDPAVYLTTARKLGVKPEPCLAVEDSPNGLLSAKAAGMKCIVVPEPALRADPRLVAADALVAGAWTRSVRSYGSGCSPDFRCEERGNAAISRYSAAKKTLFATKSPFTRSFSADLARREDPRPA